MIVQEASQLRSSGGYARTSLDCRAAGLLGKDLGRQAGRLGQEKRLVACDRLTDGQGLPAASTTNIFTWKLHNSLHSLHT